MNKSAQAILLAVCILVGMVCGPLPFVGFAAQFYKYEFTYTWKFNARYLLPNTLSDAKAAAAEGMNSEAAQQFSAEMVKEGYWYKIDSTSSEVSASNEQPVYSDTRIWGYTDDFNGSTTINFETDRADLDTSGWRNYVKPASVNDVQDRDTLLSIRVQPVQIEEIIIAILGAILTALVTHATLSLILIIIVALIILLFMVHLYGGVSNLIAPGLAGEIITAIVAIGIICALVPALPALMSRLVKSSKKKIAIFSVVRAEQ